MESNVTQETLLKVMDEKTFRKLKNEGCFNNYPSRALYDSETR